MADQIRGTQGEPNSQFAYSVAVVRVIYRQRESSYVGVFIARTGSDVKVGLD